MSTEGKPTPYRELAAVNTDHLNELRDELIELRALKAAQRPCPAGSSCWQLDRDPPQTGPASTETAEQTDLVGRDTPEAQAGSGGHGEPPLHVRLGLDPSAMPEIARWKRGYARAQLYVNALASRAGASPELTAANEVLRRIKAEVDGTDVNA